MSEQAPAGWSAGERARRQRERADRLADSAARWEKGAEGEAATAAVLAQLPPDQWTVFHDLRWPGRKFANVDHIVVGPPGVFVIDSKNWSGSIRVDGDVLRVNGRARDRDVAAAAEAAIAVSQLAPTVTPQQVLPVLCFVRDDDMLAGWARDVMICSTSNLLTMLRTRPAALSDEERQSIGLELDGSMRSMAEPASYAATRLPPRGGRAAGRPASTTRRRRSRKKQAPVGQLVVAALALTFAFVPAVREPATEWLVSRFVTGTATTGESETAPRAGECPTNAPVKGFTNARGKQVYLAPGARRYAAVDADRCFVDAAAATKAGFVAVRGG
ncbi:MAG TPA: nuclease-related domain-containing protein [Nocardioides sp.]|uniref:nuclease-related domain-containing protein n=1 Tax=Nocardioides sp. TaxID=35761 RepID=UPI002EDADBE4